MASEKSHDQARSSQVFGQVRPRPRVLIRLDFQAKSGQVMAPDGRCMAGLDVYDRVFFQKNKRWIKQIYYHTPCISPETIFFKIFRESSPRYLFCKITVYPGKLGDFHRFFGFLPKIHPGAWARARPWPGRPSHGQAGHLSPARTMIRPSHAQS